MDTPSRALTVSEILDQRPLSRFQTSTIALCGLVMVLDGFDTQCIGFLAPAISENLGIPLRAFGPVFAAALFGLMIGAMASGPVADRWGRKWVVVLSTLTFATFAVLTARANTLNQFVILRFLTGLGLGGAMPNVVALTSEYTPKRLLAVFVSALFAGMPLGALVGGLVASVMIPLWGWRSVFAVGGILPLAIALVLIARLPESVRFLTLRGADPQKIARIMGRVSPELAGAPLNLSVSDDDRREGLPVKHLFTDGRAVGTVLLWIPYFMNLLILLGESLTRRRDFSMVQTKADRQIERSLFLSKRGESMRSRRHIARPILLALIIAAVASAELSSARKPAAGSPRLISYARLPEPDGDWCDWDAAALQASKVEAFQAPQSSAAGQRAAAPDTGPCSEEGCAAVAARKPLRFVQDPYAGFSSVKVDPIRNEVVLMDEFKFDIFVYDRMATTPPSASSTQPKRKIGGNKTKSQYNSDAYIDPKNGDIYVINNDSVPGLNVYSRQAQGNVPPDRELTTPYGGFGLAVDEEKQELFVTVQHDGAVMVFPKTARGNANPIRLLQGDRTHMGDPHGIALDPKNHLLFVANYGTSRQAVQGTLGPRGSPTTPRIPNWPAGNLIPYSYRHEVVLGTGKFGAPSLTVFPADAQGNASPIRVIEGPKAQLNWPTGIAVDPDRGEVYIANAVGDSIGVFSATAQGDVAPIRTLKGPRTLLKNPNGVFVDVAHDEVWVANFGNHLATVYTRTASGDTPPLRVIRSAPLDAPTTLINNPYMIAYDTKRDEILVPN